MTKTMMTSAPLTESSSRDRVVERMRALYNEDQQVKFLHLQAEADSLLQQLQSIKAQRSSEDTLHNN
ncbi:hypothetical protein ACN4EG_19100 [Alkalinema pantanalense CENA528]|uniref:hypothetical protein n=1 Tax=Alkalinema pantanalense TaxID=1620705 RepID=UPI003D6EAAE4